MLKQVQAIQYDKVQVLDPQMRETLGISPLEQWEEEERKLQEWNRWFDLCGLTEEWGKIKQACRDTDQTTTQMLGWATMVEMTRINSLTNNDGSK